MGLISFAEKVIATRTATSITSDPIVVLAGDEIIVSAWGSRTIGAGTLGFNSIADTQGNSYGASTPVSPRGDIASILGMFAGTAMAGGTLTVTVTTNSSNDANLSMYIEVWRGLGIRIGSGSAVSGSGTSCSTGAVNASTGGYTMACVLPWSGGTPVSDGTLIDQDVDGFSIDYSISVADSLLTRTWTGFGSGTSAAAIMSYASGGNGPVPLGPVVATTGVTATGTLDSGGASVSATDYTKAIVDGQATACCAITALTVSTGNSTAEHYTLTLSGLVVPGISFNVTFTNGAFTNANGVNANTGSLTGTNNSTTIDLIIDSGTLSGTTATVDFDPVNVPADMWGGSVTLSNNNASVGTFITGGTASPVVGGDLITLHGYLSDGTLIASGTLFTVASLTRVSSHVTAVLSGSLTMAPPANAFADTTWRDTTTGVNSFDFVSQSGSMGNWTISSGFLSGNSWGFSAVPTYVMNMAGVITGGVTAVAGTVATDGLSITLIFDAVTVVIDDNDLFEVYVDGVLTAHGSVVDVPPEDPEGLTKKINMPLAIAGGTNVEVILQPGAVDIDGSENPLIEIDIFNRGALFVGGHTTTTATLVWSDSTGGVNPVGMQLQRSANGTTGWANVGGATTSPATDTGLTPDTTYYYRVVYTDDDGVIVYSNVASVTTTAPAAITVDDRYLLYLVVLDVL